MTEIPSEIYLKAIDEMIVDFEDKLQELSKEEEKIQIEIAKKTIEKRYITCSDFNEKELEQKLIDINYDKIEENKYITILNNIKKEYEKK